MIDRRQFSLGTLLTGIVASVVGKDVAVAAEPRRTVIDSLGLAELSEPIRAEAVFHYADFPDGKGLAILEYKRDSDTEWQVSEQFIAGRPSVVEVSMLNEPAFWRWRVYHEDGLVNTRLMWFG